MPISRQRIVDELLGRTEAVALRKAELLGYVVFVAERDGQSFMRTADVRLDRLNFYVRDGFVRDAELG